MPARCCAVPCSSRRSAALLDFDAADGQQVELRGRLAVYEARGELQLIVESMRRLGAGALLRAVPRPKRGWRPGPVRRVAQTTGAALAAGLGIVTFTAAAAAARRGGACAGAPHVLRASSIRARCRAGRGGGAGRGTAPGGAAARWTRCCWCGAAARSEDLWALQRRRAGAAVRAVADPGDQRRGPRKRTSPWPTWRQTCAQPTPTAAAELAVPARADALAPAGCVGRAWAWRLRQWPDTRRSALDGCRRAPGRPARALAASGRRWRRWSSACARAMRQTVASAAREQAQLAGGLLR